MKFVKKRKNITVFSYPNVYWGAKGNSVYLDSIVRSLRDLGGSLSYLTCVGEGGAAKIDFGHFLEPYETVRVMGRHRWAGRAYAVDPRVWLRAITRRWQRRHQRLRQGEQSPRIPWSLPTPPDATVRWMAAKVTEAQADIAVSNYFNLADVFAFLPAEIRKVVVVHDVMALRHRSLELAGLPTDFDEGMIAREAEGFRAADVCIAIQEDEASYIRTIAPHTQVIVVPHGVEVPDYDLEAERSPVVVFVGADNGPNRDGLSWLLEVIWPQVVRRHATARLRVVGAVARTYSKPWPQRAEAVGVVPDVHVEYANAAVAVVPLRYGSGLKTKLVEALAAGLPVVATASGAFGVDEVPADVVAVRDQPCHFASAVTEFLTSATASRDRAAARATACRHYSHRRNVERLRALLA